MSVYLSLDVNFTFSFFLGDKLPINMKMLVFFLAKCVRTTVKTMVVDRKKQKALALLYLASKPLQKAVNSSSVPTEFTTELFA